MLGFAFATPFSVRQGLIQVNGKLTWRAWVLMLSVLAEGLIGGVLYGFESVNVRGSRGTSGAIWVAPDNSAA
jgi:hypothetical protein